MQKDNRMRRKGSALDIGSSNNLEVMYSILDDTSMGWVVCSSRNIELTNVEVLWFIVQLITLLDDEFAKVFTCLSSSLLRCLLDLFFAFLNPLLA